MGVMDHLLPGDVAFAVADLHMDPPNTLNNEELFPYQEWIKVDENTLCTVIDVIKAGSNGEARRYLVLASNKLGWVWNTDLYAPLREHPLTTYGKWDRYLATSSKTLTSGSRGSRSTGSGLSSHGKTSVVK